MMKRTVLESNGSPRGFMRNLPFLANALWIFAVYLAVPGLVGAGTWTPLANLAPDGINTMLLLSDGTVMCANGGNNWYLLTPDSGGSYVNGTWSALAPMNDSRLYYASAVLTNGQVFVAGGEYGSGSCSAEIYDPLLNVWRLCPGTGAIFSDALSVVLPSGRVLVAPTWPTNYALTIVFDPASGLWTSNPVLVRGFDQDEASWVKLPGDSILTDDPYGLNATNSERFIPSSNRWANDSTIPVSLYNSGDELGAAFLLPNGKAFFIGAAGNTGLYTPSGTTSPGVWAAGPGIPGGLGAPDAPAAMMVDGHVLCALIGSNGPPTSFFEYDPVANSFATVPGPGSFTNSLTPYYTRMLDLPDGTVLYSVSSDQLYDYQPSNPPLAAGQPTIVSITTNSYRSYHLKGKLLGGISQGASYGDDAQMDSNYPLVRLTNNLSGAVYYARTFNWTSTSVMAATTNSAEFLVPANLPSGNYSLVVVVNGNSSSAVPFTFTQDTLSITPPVGFAASGPTNNGGFSPTSRTYTLANNGAVPLNWAASSTSIWLNISPSSGTLLAGGPASNVVVSISSAATNLAVGTYSGGVVFSNANSGATQTIPYSLQVNSLILNGGFESGSFALWGSSGTTGSSFVGNVGTYSSVNGYAESSWIHSGFYGALLGENSALGHLTQSVSTTPGAAYLLSFWLDFLVTANPNQFQASWNGTSLFNRTNLSAFGFTNMQFVVRAPGTTATLDFGYRTATNFFGLDDVHLTQIIPPRFTNIVRNANGSVTLGLSTVAGVTSRVFTASNLNPPAVWQPIYTNLTGGGWQYTDLNATNFARRFYRATTP